MCRRGAESFGKRVRLRRRAEYLAVQRGNLRVVSHAFIGLVSIKKEGVSRLGITTAKQVGNAVQRNRTRRLVREAFRRRWMHLPEEGVDLVVVAKTRAQEIDGKAVFRDLAVLGQKVRKLVEELS